MGKPDLIVRAYGNESGITLVGDRIVADPAVHADALKFSNCTDVDCSGLYVEGGYEDALDINRGTRLHFKNCYFKSGGNFACTVKGGAQAVTFEDCVFGPGSETDIDLGNWSDQSRERTRDVTLIRCKRNNGAPVRVRCLWADPPRLIDTPAKVCRVHPILLWFFALAKRLRLA